MPSVPLDRCVVGSHLGLRFGIRSDPSGYRFGPETRSLREGRAFSGQADMCGTANPATPGLPRSLSLDMVRWWGRPPRVKRPGGR
jgi:hypothetical protein